VRECRVEFTGGFGQGIASLDEAWGSISGGEVFGYRPGMGGYPGLYDQSAMKAKERDHIVTLLRSMDRATLKALLEPLSFREKAVLCLRYGLDPIELRNPEQIAEKLGIPVSDVHARMRQIEDRMLTTRVRRPSRESVAVVTDAVEKCSKLNPQLLTHLKTHTSDLRKLHWDVFEHLVGEFLASSGFEDIRLVGRDPSTSADIAALFVVPKIGTRIRYFIEVKQWHNKVGIRVIDEILGAMLSERDRFGWTVGMLVAPECVRDFRKFKTHAEIERKGLFIKQEQDILQWLANYQPDREGLWLPTPKRSMRVANEVAGATAGGPHQLAMRSRMGARVAQF
jgi:DNA-binding MarR family transcriptional regulator